MTKELTVKDLAHQIARGNEDVDAVIARLRNWTKEGLLSPTGEKNPGTGRARVYDQTAVLNAFVLAELTEIGIPAVHSTRYRDTKGAFFEVAREGLRMAAAAWAMKKKRPSEFYLVCSGNRVLLRGEKNLTDGWKSGVVINLTDIVQRAREADPGVQFE